MVVDTSVLVAIMRSEPGWEALAKLLRTTSSTISAPNRLELHMVVSKWLGSSAQIEVDRKLADLGVRVVAFDEVHSTEACRAFDRFGKGRHAAALNFGDCIAYALAKVSNQPLLFVGEDFAKTDIRVA